MLSKASGTASWKRRIAAAVPTGDALHGGGLGVAFVAEHLKRLAADDERADTDVFAAVRHPDDADESPTERHGHEERRGHDERRS